MQAHRTESHAFRVDVDPAHELAERQRDDREVEAAHAAQRRKADQRTGAGPHQSARNERQRKRHLEVIHEEAGRVGTYPEERRVRERELPQIPDHDIEADPDQHIDQDEIDDILDIVID